MAADRQLGPLAGLNTPWQPAVLRLVGLTVEGSAAEGHNKPVGVCGEAAADPALAVVLTGLGVTTLSMTARSTGGRGRRAEDRHPGRGAGAGQAGPVRAQRHGGPGMGPGKSCRSWRSSACSSAGLETGPPASNRQAPGVPGACLFCRIRHIGFRPWSRRLPRTPRPRRLPSAGWPARLPRCRCPEPHARAWVPRQSPRPLPALRDIHTTAGVRSGPFRRGAPVPAVPAPRILSSSGYSSITGSSVRYHRRPVRK